MKKKLMKMTALLLSAALVGCGQSAPAPAECGPAKEEAAAPSEPEKPAEDDAQAEPVADTAAEEPEESAAQEQVGSGPKVYIKSFSDVRFEDNKICLMDYRADMLYLEDASAAEYPLLDAELKKLADERLEKTKRYAAESEEWSKAEILPQYATLEEAAETLPEKSEYKLYLRRNDEKVLSFLGIRETSLKDSEASYELEAHNFDPATGKEIQLWDLVKDKESFYTLLLPHFQERIEKVAGYNGIMTEDRPDDSLETLTDIMERGNFVWTWDPQGVTLGFPSYTMLPVPLYVTVLFAEDTEGKAFIPDAGKEKESSWVMYVPMWEDTVFDREDDGKPDMVRPMAMMGEWDVTERLAIVYNDARKEFELEEAYGLEPMLVHREGDTSLLLSYSMYDYSYLDLYELSGKEPVCSDTVSGYIANTVEWDPEKEPDLWVSALLTDPSSFRVQGIQDLLSTLSASREFMIRGGAFIPIEDYWTYEDVADVVLFVKVPELELPLVDGASHQKTGEMTTLYERQSLKFLYTDGETYVDFLTEDSLVVRAEVTFEEELGQAVNGRSIQEIFDGMMFAG